MQKFKIFTDDEKLLVEHGTDRDNNISKIKPIGYLNGATLGL